MGVKGSKEETEEISPLKDPVFGALAKETLMRYSCDDFPFVPVVQSVLGCKGIPMGELHNAAEYCTEELLPDGAAPSTSGPRDNCFNKRWQTAKHDPEASGYDEFARVYHDFLRDVVRTDLGEEMVLYQRIPTLRVHLVGASAIGRPHRDADYHHTAFEINYWLPLSDVGGTNSLWVESSRGEGDFHPFVASYGEVVRFYGNQVWHYAVRNDSCCSRVSFDFRVVRFSDLRRSGVPVDFNRTALSRVDHRKRGHGGQFCLGSFYGLMGPTGEVPRDVAEGLCAKIGLLQ